MSCDRYLELLSARLDGALTEQEERELEEHLAVCPDCRAAGAQLAALRDAFGELEDIPAPEGFAEGVMDRVRAEKKIVPLFRRSRFRALAGLAACAALAIGLYGAGNSQRKSADGEVFDLMVRSFNQNAVAEFADAADAPMYAACPADPEGLAEGREYSAEREAQKSAASEDAVLYDGDAAAPAAVPVAAVAVLTVDRMPEGGWELIPPETPVSPEGLLVTRELFAEIDRLAQEEEGITASVTTGWKDAEEFVIVVLEET